MVMSPSGCGGRSGVDWLRLDTKIEKGVNSGEGTTGLHICYKLLDEAAPEELRLSREPEGEEGDALDHYLFSENAKAVTTEEYTAATVTTSRPHGSGNGAQISVSPYGLSFVPFLLVVVVFSFLFLFFFFFFFFTSLHSLTRAYAFFHIADEFELDDAKHQFELETVAKGDKVVVHVDTAHCGVGGDCSWAPQTHRQYWIGTRKDWSYNYQVTLTVV